VFILAVKKESTVPPVLFFDWTGAFRTVTLLNFLQGSYVKPAVTHHQKTSKSTNLSKIKA
jgi:hypothetical protein